MQKKYPTWIDEYAKSFHNEFINMVPGSFGPIDGFAFFTLLNGAFISKVHEAITNIKKQGYDVGSVAKTFASPSDVRIAIYYLLLEYQHTEPKNKKVFREVVDYLIEILSYITKKDMFALESNIAHSDEEIGEILTKTNWQTSDVEAARAIGKFSVSLNGMAYAQFRDFMPQQGSETYGPYDASKDFGENTILLLKHYINLRPTELWPDMSHLPYSEVKIYQVYKDIKFRCGIVGQHSQYEGDVIGNLVSYAVFVDGEKIDSLEKIKDLTGQFASSASEKSLVYDNMSKQDLKMKMLEWECYMLKVFFKLAAMDWRPTQQMWDEVKDKEVGDRTELDFFPAFEEFIVSSEYEVYWLKDLYK